MGKRLHVAGLALTSAGCRTATTLRSVPAATASVRHFILASHAKIYIYCTRIWKMNNIQVDHHSQEPDDFEAWINERPKWLQSAARLLIDSKRMPNDDEVVELARLCFKEASGEKEGFSKIIPGALAQAAQRPELRINNISDVSGVNAIKAGASLAFGNTNLAVIYGANGTGKTSFSRIRNYLGGSELGSPTT